MRIVIAKKVFNRKIPLLKSKLTIDKRNLPHINNLREKFSPGPGIEPGSPALRAGAITTKPPRRSAGPS